MKIQNVKSETYVVEIRMTLFSLGFCFLAFLPCLAIAGQQYSAKVERVIDGDTIRVTLKANSIKVRLWGIDTPEYYQAYSKAAKKFTTRLVNNASVQLEAKDWDDYGRMVATVTMADGRSLNEELLKSGLAWVHIYYCKEAICDKWYGYEKRARKNRIGLWKDTFPVPPWVWKRNKKK